MIAKWFDLGTYQSKSDCLDFQFKIEKYNFVLWHLQVLEYSIQQLQVIN